MPCRIRIVTRCNGAACRVSLLRENGHYSERTMAIFSSRAEADAWVKHHTKHALEEGCDVERKTGMLKVTKPSKRRRRQALAVPAPVTPPVIIESLPEDPNE